MSEGEHVSDYRIVTRVKNNRILRRIEERGFASVAEFCRQHALSYAKVIALIAMKESPAGKDGWLRFVETMAAALSCDPADLFNDRQVMADFQTTTFIYEVDASSVPLLESSADVELERRDMVERLMEQLTPRERRIVELRYGLNGEGEHTLDETSVESAELAEGRIVSRDRISQIEWKAIRKMQRKAHQSHLALS